jgi:hypothetical protein
MTIDPVYFGYGAGLVMVGWIAGMMVKYAISILIGGSKLVIR